MFTSPPEGILYPMYELSRDSRDGEYRGRVVWGMSLVGLIGAIGVIGLIGLIRPIRPIRPIGQSAKPPKIARPG